MLIVLMEPLSAAPAHTPLIDALRQSRYVISGLPVLQRGRLTSGKPIARSEAQLESPKIGPVQRRGNQYNPGWACLEPWTLN
ncbi:hypothetical protein J6590_056725 [Homalodisca vitripennis]|nr:hypothetical protein J6590_094823 [Homalodisca vitripennis]KAG8306050.1 hypothetical protein J6590_056725 [Homalodisca vitripennis]